MLKPSRNIYKIIKSPFNDNEKLESLLNKMSEEGWELYSMQEIDNDDDVYYNCIFVQEAENDDDLFDNDLMLDFRPRIERIINPALSPYELCLDLLKKIKDKRDKITQVKSLIDETSEDSRFILNEEISKHIKELEELKTRLIKTVNPDIMADRLKEAKISLSLSEESAPLLDTASQGALLPQIVLTRQALTDKSGCIMPKIKMEIDETLEENQFIVKVRGIPAFNSAAYYGYTMFYENELHLDTLPEDSIKSFDVISGLDTVWINDETAEDYWVKGISAAEYTASVIESTVIKYIDEIFDYSDVNRYIEIAGNQNLFLIENIIPDFLSIAELKYILTSLIKERVSIKDIMYIFEKINDFTYLEDKEELLSHLRISLNRQISASLCADNSNEITVYELPAELIKLFSGLDLNSNEDIVRIDRAKIDGLIKRLQAKLKTEGGEIIILAPAGIRHIVFLVLHQFVTNIRVIAREEIHSDFVLNIAGKI